jgi:hypothetical protein
MVSRRFSREEKKTKGDHVRPGEVGSHHDENSVYTREAA